MLTSQRLVNPSAALKGAPLRRPSRCLYGGRVMYLPRGAPRVNNGTRRRDVRSSATKMRVRPQDNAPFQFPSSLVTYIARSVKQPPRATAGLISARVTHNFLSPSCRESISRVLPCPRT